VKKEIDKAGQSEGGVEKGLTELKKEKGYNKKRELSQVIAAKGVGG